MTQTFVCSVGTSSRTSLIRPPSVKGSKYLFVTEMEAGSLLVRPVVFRFGTPPVQLRGRRLREISGFVKSLQHIFSSVGRAREPLLAPLWSAYDGVPMDAPYLDPSRARREKAGVLVRTARLIGLVMFVTGVILGCYVGLHWLQTGRIEATLLEDVVFAKLPAGAQGWVTRPRSWYGLHRFVIWVLRIPLFAAVAFSGFLVLLAIAPRGGNRAA